MEKHSSLLGAFISYIENEVLRIWPRFLPRGRRWLMPNHYFSKYPFREQAFPSILVFFATPIPGTSLSLYFRTASSWCLVVSFFSQHPFREETFPSISERFQKAATATKRPRAPASCPGRPSTTSSSQPSWKSSKSWKPARICAAERACSRCSRPTGWADRRVRDIPVVQGPML
jgi:hypothetical protein